MVESAERATKKVSRQEGKDVYDENVESWLYEVKEPGNNSF